MSKSCTHLSTIVDVTPSALGCEECLKIGQAWVHLRLCRACGHVGCCDDLPGRHATKHFRATGHPDHRGLRSAGRMGLVLCRQSRVRPHRPYDPSQWPDPAVLLERNENGPSVMGVFAVLVVCQRLDHAAVADAAMTAGVHHPLQFRAKGGELADAPVDLAHVTARDAVGLRA